MCLQKTGGFVRNWPLVHAKFACDWRPSASRIQIVPAWPSVTCNMNKIDWRPRGYNLHATNGHSGTIFMRLAATRVHFACEWWPLGYKTRDKQTRSVKGRLYIIIMFFFYHWHVYILDACFWLYSWQPLDIWFGKCAGIMDDIATRKQILHALAASCAQSRQFFASTLREKLLWIKKWRRH